MKKILTCLLFGLGLLTCSFAQCPEPAPRDLNDPESQFQLICGYTYSEDHTNVSADFRITGEGPYDSVDVAKGVDPILGRFTLQVKGNRPIQPKSVFFHFYTHSANPSRYPDGVRLTIWVDGKVFLWSDRPLSDAWKVPAYTTKWFCCLEFPFSEFAKIASAEKVSFQIGETKADLVPREHQRIRDFYSVIQKPDAETSQ